ncbi:glycosyltransferase family 39 protein [Crocosphaera sp. UHCC 0190]|uniref:ArnT family glycosyltransferase n=1 Tax=Crocosphaera sp. UHCC 0190 TaxID=3110246 RepID=UPI002B1FE041|nr:glycosyltransferase family 39 protein [Crocosphaera sp. UHCC 0190]MEA5511869.1 glycosyltransferase family 39 protein [Crocosphaera sp. UHCC 0190]
MNKFDLSYPLKSTYFCFFILLILALFLWFIGLGNLPLRDWDEGYYGTVAKDMFKTENWLYLTYYGQPFLLKPPLIIWLINLSYQLGGISEFTTRFPCALLTAFGVPLLYLVGKNIFSQQLPAILSSLVYLTLLPVIRHGRLGMIDGIINTFLIFSILCLVKSRKHPRWAIGYGIGLGLIALSKGTLVIALGAIIGVYILLDKPANYLKNPALWLGICLGFMPVFIWYCIQINHYGDIFIQVHFLQQNFDRLATAVEGNSGSFWYYGLELIKYSFPWLLFLPGSLILAWRQKQQSWAKLVLTGFCLFLAIITLMGTKLPWYIMPIYPFLALGIGAYLSQFWQEHKSSPSGLIFGFFLASIASLFGAIYLLIEGKEISLIITGFIVFFTFLLSWQKIRKSFPDFVIILIIGLYMSLGIFMTSQSWIWELNEAFPVKPVATLIKQHTPANTIIYTSFAYSRPSLDFYSDRQVLAQDQSALEKLALSSSYLLLDQNSLKNLPLSNAKILGKAEGFILVSTSENH